MIVQHKTLGNGRWAQMSISEQMANIGSEVERAISWKTKKNDSYSEMAFHRALELIDFSLESTRRYPQLKEFARLREALVDYFYGSNECKSTEASWRKYFLHFNYAARKNT